MTSRITKAPLDPPREARAVGGRGIGGVALFVGVVRADRTHLGTVRALRYEAYVPLARRELSRLEKEARKRWGRLNLRVVHRVGVVAVGSPSVVVAVGAPHRAQAFDACRFLIDRLKAEVPIWKSDLPSPRPRRRRARSTSGH